MPFDGLGSHGDKSSDNNRLLTVCRRAANALALMWPQGPLARRFEDKLLREKIEAAIIPELLQAAQSLIASEETWTKGRLRTRDDNSAQWEPSWKSLRSALGSTSGDPRLHICGLWRVNAGSRQSRG